MTSDDDRVWMDRYPGVWKGIQLSPGRPCLACGNPGYVVPAPADMPTALSPELDDSLTAPALATANTCPGHEWIVRRHLAERFAPRRMAYREGRP